MSTLQINTPEWAIPLLQPSRYKAVHGGRGSGKSHFFGDNLIESHVHNPDLSSVCIREVQKSIKMSVKRLLELKIQTMNVGSYFEIQDQIIKSRKGKGVIIFEGMQNHNSDSIKSLEAFDIAWFAEAQRASQKSLDLLRPTIRKPGSEIWFDWNPEEPTDPVDVLFRGKEPAPPDSIIIETNYWDNPWFPDVLRTEMEYDKSRDFDKYNWIWEGKYRKLSRAIVFKNWRIEEFDTDPAAMLRFGADWGFANDPSTLVRLYTVGRTLYIDYEAYEVGCEIDDLPDLFMQVPDSERWPIIADSARPETISYMKRHGFPKIRKAVKGKGSLYEGVEFLKTYDIVVHPRCKHMIQELSHYKYKVDPDTHEILPILEDENNHVIDALRYALENDRRSEKVKREQRPHFTPIPVVNHM